MPIKILTWNIDTPRNSEKIIDVKLQYLRQKIFENLK